MGPFLVFAVILGIIWMLSALATWANKQKEEERRARLRQMMSQPSAAASDHAVQRAWAQQQQVRQQISEGIAARFPDVLLPPAPRQPQKAQQRAPRPVAKKGKRRAQPQAPVLPPPPLQEPATFVAPLPEAALTSRQTAARSVSPRITAQALATWMKPQTLNQQFLYTDIFQPPVGLRDRIAGL